MDCYNKPSAIPYKIISGIANKVTKIIFNIEVVDEKVYDTIMGTHEYFKFLILSLKKVLYHNIMVEGHFVPILNT